MMLWSVQSVCISPYFHSHCLVQAEADGVYVFPEEHGTKFRGPRATLCPSVTHRGGYFSTRGSSSAEGFGRATPAETPAPTVPTAHTVRRPHGLALLHFAQWCAQPHQDPAKAEPNCALSLPPSAFPEAGS